jgi:short-subunit dehydrogenase
MKLKTRVALVTGGIGEVTARLLAKEGITVFLTARNSLKLGKIEKEITDSGGAAFSIPADLTIESERLHVLKTIKSAYSTIDILINNAGFGWYGFGHMMQWNTARDMVELNISAVVHLTLMVLQEMKQRDEGLIINISSIAANLPSQGIALYSATKAFIDNFSTSLYREMKRSGVKICAIKPGPVKTDFFSSATQRPNGLNIPASGSGISASRVARTIVGLIKHPRKTIYIPRIFSLIPIVEFCFSWIIDLMGPFLLNKKTAHT